MLHHKKLIDAQVIDLPSYLKVPPFTISILKLSSHQSKLNLLKITAPTRVPCLHFCSYAELCTKESHFF